MQCPDGASEEVPELPLSAEYHHAESGTNHRRSGILHGQRQPTEEYKQGESAI